MDRTFIVGWYGMHNTGDDALFAVAAWGAQQQHSAASAAATAQSLPVLPAGLQVIPVQSPTQFFKGQNRLRRYYHAWRSARVLFGGGSVFQTSKDINDKITMMKLSASSGHQAVGVSLGPFVDEHAERACAEALRRLDFAGLRDAESYDIARALAPDTPVAQTFDLAPLLFDAYGYSRERPAPGAKKKSLGLALCPFESVYHGEVDSERQRLDKIADALRRLDRDAIDELVLIDFNGHAHFGDHDTHRQLAHRLDGILPLRHLRYSPDLRDAVREIAALDVIVAMRLHAAVFAYLVDTPTLVLAYHRKCYGWAEQIGLADEQVLDGNAFDAEQLAALLERGMNHGLTPPTLAFSEAHQCAMGNWQGGTTA